MTASSPKTELGPLSNSELGLSLAGKVAKALSLSKQFRARHRWPHVVVVFRLTKDGLEIELVARGDFIGRAIANDLGALAHEARRRYVPPGHVLAFCETDTETSAGHGFVLVPLLQGRRA